MSHGEYLDHCYAKLGPAKLKAIEDRMNAKFANFPGVVKLPECRPPPPPPKSDTGRSTTGLFSPGASEHGGPASPHRKLATTKGGSSNDAASACSGRSTEQRSRSPNTSKTTGKTCLGKDPRMSKVERRRRKINARIAHSKTSSAASLSEIDGNDSLNEESPPTEADSSGKNLSSRLEPSPRISAPQSITEAAPSKPAARDKRKRDQDDTPTRKRARIESSNVVSPAVLASAGSSDETLDPVPTLPSRVEDWLQGQKPVHVEKEIYPWSHASIMEKTNALEEFLRSKQNLRSVAPTNSWGFSINRSVVDKNTSNDPPKRRARHSLSDRVPNRIPKTTCKHLSTRSMPLLTVSPALPKPSGIQKVAKKLKEIHNRKVENLISACIATGDYCKALELDEKGTEHAKICLNEVFHHPFSEYHHTHAIIIACIYFVWGAHPLKRKWGVEIDQVIWPPEIPRPDCGPAIAAVNQYFLSQDTKRMRPKATRRGPTASQKSSRPTDYC